ncbi:hypothetical protein [Mangrovimonas aestuarii]|uniref:hypothetical protein n=1 Tax=Mangrovimonas aestuarii TaxID=3018443 RepID=UPI002378AA66|nr:hypothetical protein [Mangrovimonas aestuarii]
MRKSVLAILFIWLVGNVGLTQNWMTNIDIAKRLALTQNKMLLMVWDDASSYPLPVVVLDSNGNEVPYENLFDEPRLNHMLWDSFVLVKVSESEYSLMYNEIKRKRPTYYLDKFNDDSLKVMDVNGNILNASEESGYVFNLSSFIQKYALNTSFLRQELINYRKEKNFYSTFYLASKYIDFAFYVNKEVRPELVGLSDIYLKEAHDLLEREPSNNKADLELRFELLKIEQDLLINKPEKALRKLKRIKESELNGANKTLAAFLYFTAYRLLKDEKNASLWRSKVSLADLNKIQVLINK